MVVVVDDCCACWTCSYFELLMCHKVFIKKIFLFSDYEGILLEQTRCFFHISHVYHNEGRHKESFMAALQELNTAEKIGNNFHEVCGIAFLMSFMLYTKLLALTTV